MGDLQSYRPTRAQRLRYSAGLLLVLLAIVATRYQEIDLPLLRWLKGPNQVDPLTLHLSGEFMESNLGLRQDADGSLTLRMIAQQFLFVPQCVVLPAGVTVHLRITSADAVHMLTVAGTKYAVKVVPGAVSQTSLEFFRPGDYKMPCGEFCGAGHYAMQAHLHIVPREQFSLADSRMGSNCGVL
jgi:cytochrome c oxidase subunit 2